VPKRIPEDDLVTVENQIRQRKAGASMADLVGQDASEADRRAMQRRIKKLAELGRVKSVGARKATKYFTIEQQPPSFIHEEEAQLGTEHGLFVPLSEAGQKLQRDIRAPQAQRNPIGYQRSFLTGYAPNATYYLTEREREHLAKVGAGQVGIQPAGTYVRRILDRLLIDLAWNSSRLEGNRYTILDTHILIDQGKQAEGKTAEDAQMILNHKDAIEFLVEAANDIAFNRHTILNLHALLSNNLLPDPHASGRLRRKEVAIGHSAYMPLQIPEVLEECFSEMLAKAGAIADPFEQAFFVTVQLPYLQPFEDVNKRVARLAANIPMVKKNLSPLSFVDVPDSLYKEAILSVYELNRTELARDVFIWAYERSARRYAAIRQSIGEPDVFRMRYRDMLRSIVMEVIQGRLNKTAATKYVDDWVAANITDEDRTRFVEVAESELIGMHEGNFARYRVRPSEFFAWKQVWELPD
jgi:hypothetical protein